VTEVLSGDLAGRQALARGRLRLAAFSRNQELQADVIGIRMLGEAGYDPYAAARFLQSMAAYSRFRAPDADDDPQMDFLASHPSAPQRIDLARRHAQSFGAVGVGDADRELYLNGIDGLLFGDSAEEGFVRGQSFLHPRLRIRFDVPRGFTIENTADAVLATGPGDIAIRFDSVEDPGGSLPAYLNSGWVAGLVDGSIRPIEVNGLDGATARAVADRWQFDVTVIRVGDRIYRFLTAAPLDSDALEAAAGVLQQSFRRLSAAEAASLDPLSIAVVTAAPGDTVASLAARMDGIGTDDAELFRLLNALGAGDRVRAGARYKIVTD
jgi:predicted Zn-dependent protease